MNHTTSYLTADDGHRIFTQTWTPDGAARAGLVISHGYAEHGGRYAHVGEYFAGKGYHVCAPDHRAHGRSDGRNTYVRSFDLFLSDLGQVVRETGAALSNRPLFLLGHSMGGAIALAYVMNYQPDLRGVLLSAPVIMTGDDIPPIMIKLAGFLGTVVPHMPTIKLDAKSVSRDPAVVASYESDPLNYRGGIPARTGAELNRVIEWIRSELAQFSLPCFLANGSADKLSDPGVSQFIYDRCSSEDKTVHVYDGLFHEILNEPEKETVMSDMLAWMEARQ
jgi:alpha-beta hydrolase superfamily lysophospholipase